jgi:hypothetical protein
MEANTMENGLKEKNMEWENIPLQMETFFRESGFLINKKET